jgi:uncharacterized repeat protein (TIGR03803 family)
MKALPSALVHLSYGLALLSLTVGTSPARTQPNEIHFEGGNFDVNIAFGCDCTCFCDSNTTAANNPVGAFFLANSVSHVACTTTMPLAGQLVPPHWTLFRPATPPYCEPFYLEGWTQTGSSVGSLGYLTPFWQEVTGFNFLNPLNFQVPFEYHEDLVTPAGVGSGGQPVPSLQATRPQPYPWNINTTLRLQSVVNPLNYEVYVLEQQLAVGFPAEECEPPLLDTPVYWRETNGVLRITLLCTTNGISTPVDIHKATIIATLENVNIPPPLDQTVPGAATDPLFPNWTWPLTILDTPSVGMIAGSAGTEQARAVFFAPTTFDGVEMLVRAHRSYTLTISYSVPADPANPHTIVVPTGLVPPCTNTDIVIVTGDCIGTNPPPDLCYDADLTGQVHMLGPQTLNSDVRVRAYGGPLANSYMTTLATTPGTFHLYQVVGSDACVNAPFFIPDTPYAMQAIMSLSGWVDYEYFASPVLYPVEVPCDVVTDVTDVFVMCPGNPGLLQGTVNFSGPVDSGYWNGTPALSKLRFAAYDSNGMPTDGSGGPVDPKLATSSHITAVGGKSEAPPLLSVGGGRAITEFNHPGAFSATPNLYVGDYSFRLAGLRGQPSRWDLSSLQLVFDPPVNLAYTMKLTAARFTNHLVTCGTSVTLNLTNCFGLHTARVINTGSDPYVSATITVKGTGPGYTVEPFTVPAVLLVPTGGQQEADVQLFLPEGDYEYTASVIKASGGLDLHDTAHFSILCATNPCLQVVCPTNKILPCTEKLVFDLPTASSCCEGDVVITELGTVTTGTPPCGLIHTRSWLITDSCGNSNVCSQAITSVDTTPPVFNTMCVTNTLADGGTSDSFSGPEPASPSSGLWSRLQQAGIAGLKGFDDCTENAHFAHTYTNLWRCGPAGITAARLTAHLKPCAGTCGNDTVALGFTDGSGVVQGNHWERRLGSDGSVPGLFPGDWCNHIEGEVVTWDLAALPQSDGTFLSLLPELRQHGYLDVTCQDDTAVDYLVLEVTSCCGCGDLTVECGKDWQWVTPTAVDACCGTNVTLTVLTTVTNGACPWVITRTWEATDCCSNSVMCTQTVTVVDTTPPIFTFCPTNRTMELGAGCAGTAQPVVTVVRHFNLTDGEPTAALLEGSDGRLYGNSASGGANGEGMAFTLLKDGSGYAVLRAFSGASSDGHHPSGPLVEASNGSLYGTTSEGGGYGSSMGDGTVFKLQKDGSAYAVLRSFPLSYPGDGAKVQGGVVEGSDGALYGTTYGGGSSFAGTVFRMEPDGTGYAILRSFSGYPTDGSGLHCTLLAVDNGVLYGSTTLGGASGLGTVFKLNEDGSGYTVLHHFNGTDGGGPAYALMQGTDGALYGTTVGGGAGGVGTVYKLHKDGSAYTVLHSFSTTGGDGQWPHATLVRGCDGALYGTTLEGGSNGYGTVFKLQEDGSGYVVVWNFGVTAGDGQRPWAGLLRASDNALYGTTSHGGNLGDGTVFKLEYPGQDWEWEAPTALDACCGTNVTVSILTTVTNGTGPWVITRTWEARDCCSNSVMCSQTVTVIDTALPFITRQPTDLAVLCPGSARFSVAATGVLPLGYQWYFEDQPILHANGPVLNLDSVGSPQAGRYHVTVTNAFGSTESEVARLTVQGWDPPKLSIVQQSEQITLSWPACAVFVLEEARSLKQPVTWSPSTASVALVGNRYAATVPRPGVTTFYRLRN